LWLSTVVDDPARKKDCLRKVLNLDPNNQSASTALAELEKPAPVILPDAPPNLPVPQGIPIPDTQPNKVSSIKPAGEIILFRDENITVTDRRVLTGKEVYPLNGITSAGIRKIPPVWRYILILVIPIVACFAAYIFGYLSVYILGRTGLLATVSSFLGFTATFAIIGTLAGLVIGILQAVLARPKYAVMLKAWTNEISVFTSRERIYVEQIVASINQSIRQYGANQPGQSGPVPMQLGASSNSAWRGGELAGMIIASILMPIFGLIYGIYGLTKEMKRGQGAILLVVAIVSMIVYSILINSLLGG
jgi:hypothetical protein